MKSGFWRLAAILVIGVLMALGIRALPKISTQPETRGQQISMPSKDEVMSALLPRHPAASGKTHFAPPPEAPMEVHRIPLKEWDARHAAKQRAPGTPVGHFKDGDAALEAVNAAIAKHGGKGTFSATFGEKGRVIKTDADGIAVIIY